MVYRVWFESKIVMDHWVSQGLHVSNIFFEHFFDFITINIITNFLNDGIVCFTHSFLVFGKKGKRVSWKSCFVPQLGRELEN